MSIKIGDIVAVPGTVVGLKKDIEVEVTEISYSFSGAVLVGFEFHGKVHYTFEGGVKLISSKEPIKEQTPQMDREGELQMSAKLTNKPGVTNTINSSTGIKHDQGKARISLLPGLAIEQVMKVGEFGAGKYDDHNFRKGMPVVKYIDAAYRHVFIEWLFKGRDLDIDPDCYQCQNGTCANNPDPKLRKHSGLPHLAHGAWNFLAALEQMLLKPELDNRYKGEKK